MTQEKVRRLDRLTGQLVETLMTAALVAEEIRSEVRSEIDEDDVAHHPSCGSATKPCKSRPLLSESTLSVSWKGRSLYLGHTLSFRLLERLARRPNQYVTHLDLLHDVWDNEEIETPTIRSVVRHLRQRLRDGGMKKLASAIEGHNGRYILKLG